MHVETLKVNGFSINLPVGLETTMDTPVRDSYQEFLKESTRDVVRHLTCLTTLLPKAIEDLDAPYVLHAFGGVGASAQVVDQSVANATHFFFERDPTCLDYLSSLYPNVHAIDDSMKMLASADLTIYDVLLLDMSVGTIKTKGVKEMWDNVSRALRIKPEIIVWFTDTSCHKIHLNYKTYAKDFGGEVLPTAESYLEAYDMWLSQLGVTITDAMREAGEFYCVAKRSGAAYGNKRFVTIPYV
jgi:hypothetical protein